MTKNRAIAPGLAVWTKTLRLRIGIDVDGVLADQIEGIIPRVRAGLGIELTSREQITDWSLPLGESDIAKEIFLASVRDPDYVRNMKAHVGAREVLRELCRDNTVVIVTARHESVRGLTVEWLRQNRLPHDGVIFTKEGQKSLHALDVLIDDHLGNVSDVLRNGDTVAILVDQPWNRGGRASLCQWEGSARLFVVDRLSAIPPLITSIKSRRPPP